MPQALELEYIRPGVVTYPPGATFGPRRIRDFELVWIVRGDVQYHVDGTTVATPTGSMILARPGFHDAFTWDPANPTRHAFFHFKIRQMPEDWPEPDTWPIHWLMPDRDIVRPLFRLVLTDLPVRGDRRPGPQPQPTMVRAVETILSALLLGPLAVGQEMGREYPRPVSAALEHVRRVLGADPAAEITLAEVAAAAAVSREHLCRLFKATFSVGPMYAVGLLRLDVAVGLLARSNLSIKEIAHRCGFHSPFYFSRRFAKVYGRTPTAVRQAVHNGQSPPPPSPLMHFAREV